nr:MAG TPA: hypothetical protein [Bacteriophage sp.]
MEESYMLLDYSKSFLSPLEEHPYHRQYLQTTLFHEAYLELHKVLDLVPQRYQVQARNQLHHILINLHGLHEY